MAPVLPAILKIFLLLDKNSQFYVMMGFVLFFAKTFDRERVCYHYSNVKRATQFCTVSNGNKITKTKFFYASVIVTM
jgi:hypothetical protein